ncbi:MAG: hypothetical protein L6R38_001947 [Xanthoria sp. 2 TBL-2021]|nr:MAG: hypothetical protein L6R38_001947 [Xanthoria sp. 2 TBL-2021]
MTSGLAPQGGFPLDRLAPELQHMIFAAADTCDVPNLRLTCKSLGAVGLEYLLPEVELLFTPKSFDRLRGISEHPTLSRHVKSLVYRTDSLEPCRNILDLYQQIPQAAFARFWYSNSCGPKPLEEDLRYKWSSWLRDHPLSSLDTSTQTRLHEIWVKYQALWNQQQRLRESGFGKADIMAAMSTLPKLKHVTLSNFIDLANPEKDRDCYHQALNLPTYADVLAASNGDCGSDHGSGSPQLLSLLHGIVNHKITINTLSFGWVEWQLFESRGIIDLVGKALQSLTALKMRLIVDTDCGDDPYSVSVCGHILAFFQSLSDLRTLDVIFDSTGNIGQEIDLSAVFGKIVWPNLSTISVSDLKTSQKAFISFLERHARTLKVLSIGFIDLREGTWPRVWAIVRDHLDLVNFEITGAIGYESDNDEVEAECECRHNNGKIRDYVLRAAGTEEYTAQALCKPHGQQSFD